jgi:hypothetical protein
MRPEELVARIRTQPFIPLRLHLTDGTRYDIRHPDNIIVLRQRVDIGVPADRESGIMDRVEHFSLLHVVRVEEVPPTRPSDGPSVESQSN